jgi:hypothetical protein
MLLQRPCLAPHTAAECPKRALASHPPVLSLKQKFNQNPPAQELANPNCRIPLFPTQPLATFRNQHITMSGSQTTPIKCMDHEIALSPCWNPTILISKLLHCGPSALIVSILLDLPFLGARDPNGTLHKKRMDLQQASQLPSASSHMQSA